MSQRYFEYLKYKIHIAITNHIPKQLSNTGQVKPEGIHNWSFFYSRHWYTTTTKFELCVFPVWGENNRKNMELIKKRYFLDIPTQRVRDNPTRNNFINRKG